MNATAVDGRGTLIKGRDAWRVNNAWVEDVSTHNGRTGHIRISYRVGDPNHLIRIEFLRLNIDGRTQIRSRVGQSARLRDIRPGMWVDAEFSPAMTRSDPPQAQALRIVVQRGAPLPQFPPFPQLPQFPPIPQFPQLPPPQPSPPKATTTGRVIHVDMNNRLVTTGSPFNMGRQMRFAITGRTIILNRNGNRIPLRMLWPGQLVEVEHASYQTMNIPPQSPAFRIRVI